MIGNDLVDLSCASKESNWQRSGFLEKLFTKEEQAWINQAQHKLLAVWLLWSQKESAYKIVAKLEQRRFFAPKKLLCRTPPVALKKNTPSVFGLVQFKDHHFTVQSKITNDYIHTIAQLETDEASFKADSFFISDPTYQSQHLAVQKQLIQQVAKICNLPPSNLFIQKDKLGIPYLFNKEKKLSTDFSISHHGHYGGFVIKK